MDSHRIVIRTLAIAVGAAIGLGLATAALIPSRPNSALAVSVGPLPGRHLEIPWWETIAKQQVGNEVTYVLPADILFNTASSAISPEGIAVLSNLAPQLKKARAIVIAGCTDSEGGVDSPYNIGLSQRRAMAAHEQLVADGVPNSLISTQAWADTHPVATPPGLDQATINALNRRIVVTVTEWVGR